MKIKADGRVAGLTHGGHSVCPAKCFDNHQSEWRCSMHIITRRNAMQMFGLASITPLLHAQGITSRQVVTTTPGENRFAYTVPGLKTGAPCKLTAKDTGGACSIFELITPPRMGPPRHVHHREDEWYYVLQGEFLFEVGGVQYALQTGATIWAPRDIPHVWANKGTTDARMILMCQPGGFENFFDELAKAQSDKVTSVEMDRLMAKYGMEMLGPPMFAPSH
jgi:quercetin dioxygenase-like cupin family protein